MPARRHPLKVAPGGVAAELGLADPRKARLERFPPAGTPPGYTPIAPRPDPDDDGPRRPILERLPGFRGRKTGKVRCYHRVNDGDDLCWAFTITKAAFEQLAAGEALSAEGATYPDRRPVIPLGGKPHDFPIVCGTCGTHSVLCVDLKWFEV